MQHSIRTSTRQLLSSTSLCAAFALICLLSPITARADTNLAVQIESLRASLGTPGLVLGVQRGSEPAEIVSAGVGDTEKNVALSTGEPFGVGSITKLFVAVVILQLAEEGKLSLDDKLSQHYPGVEGGDNITLRMLLNHSSGLFDYADLRYTLPLPLVMIALSKEWEPADVVDIVNLNEPYFAPGASWHYSNSNYVLLGLIIEKITGNTAAEELQSRIFAPLGMATAELTGKDNVPEQRSVCGYESVGSQLHSRELWENPSLAWTAGGIVANAADLLKFSAALFGGRLLSADSMRELKSTIPRPEGGRYGLGLMVEQSVGGELIGHEGQTLGFRSGLWYLPEHDTSFVVLSNMSNIDLAPIYKLLAEQILADSKTAAAGS